jgi:hypothetical protein
MKGLGKLDPEQKKAQGAIINGAKVQIENALTARRDALANAQLEARLNAEAIDVTLPGRGRSVGGIHPVMRSWERVEEIFRSIGFDFGAVGHVETDRTEDLFDAFPRAHHRMQAASAKTAARQRDIDRFRCQPLIQQHIRQRLTARIQCCFHLLLDRVDACAFGLAGFRVEFAQAFQQFREHPGLTEKAGLFVFERGRISGVFEGVSRVGDNLVQIH